MLTLEQVEAMKAGETLTVTVPTGTVSIRREADSAKGKPTFVVVAKAMPKTAGTHKAYSAARALDTFNWFLRGAA